MKRLSALSVLTSFALILGSGIDASTAADLGAQSVESSAVAEGPADPSHSPPASSNEVTAPVPSLTPEPQATSMAVPQRSTIEQAALRSVILQFPGTTNAQLDPYLADWGITPDNRYSEVFTGFSAAITDAQISAIRLASPGVVVSEDGAVSIEATQTGAIWNLSSLDGTAVPPNSSYTYPTSAGADVTVYVIDTGRSPYSNEFGVRSLPGVDFVGDGNGAVDCEGHGSHVAGTVAGSTFGVAKATSVRALRVLDCAGSGYTSDIIAAIDWAVDDNPAGQRAVINMSLGGPGVNSAMETAIENAVSDGIMVVVAAGNDGANACLVTPANISAAVTVAAVDENNDEAYFSNYGPCADVFAPGVGITSINYTGAGRSTQLSGTSMAAPHVAGVAALYFSLHPTDSVAEAEQAILDMAETGSVNYFSGGRTQTANLLLDIAALNARLDNVSPPTVSFTLPGSNGNPRVHSAGSSVFTTTAGTWVGATVTSTSYAWLRCNDQTDASATDPIDCDIVSGAASGTYTATSADVGKHLVSRVTVSSETSSAKHYSAGSLIVDQTPVNTVKPVLIENGMRPDSTISTNSGTWTASPDPSFTYQWYSCANATSAGSTLPTGCSAITGATDSELTLTSALLGRRVLSQVKATNESLGLLQSVSAYSATSGPVVSAPTNSVAPAITVAAGSTAGADGKPTVRSAPAVSTQLTLSTGTWTGSPTFAYKWFACTNSSSAGATEPATCSLIPGATTALYRVTDLQLGKHLVGEVTATNANGSVNRFSSSLGPVTQGPVNSVAPAAPAGSKEIVGDLLSPDTGAWSGTPTPTLTFQWYLCPARVASNTTAPPRGCNAITGATSATYVPLDVQLGKFLSLQVSATNAATGTAATAAVKKFTASIQAVAASPALSATNRGGNGALKFVTSGAAGNSTVSVVTGRWPNSTGKAPAASAYTHQWYRCDDSSLGKDTTAPSGCVVIAGATATTYIVTAADVGKYISDRVEHKAKTTTKVRWTATTAQVQSPPSNTVTPTIGTEETDRPMSVGSDLRVTTGTWTGTSPVTLSYQWFSCLNAVPTASNTIPSGCTAINGATAETRTIARADVSKYMLAGVGATNAVFSPSISWKYTAGTSVVEGAPVNTTAPTISASNATANGRPQTTSTLTAATGTWSGIPAPTYGYFWYECEDAVASSSTLPDGCTLLDGPSTATTRAMTDADNGKRFAVEIRASNELGDSSTWSASTRPVITLPTFASDPSIDGSAAGGSTLTAQSNADETTEISATGYRWFRCTTSTLSANTANANCSAITGATARTYPIADADAGKYIAVEVTLTNDSGSKARVSASTAVVTREPANVTLPAPTATTGNPRVGTATTTTGGTWAGFPAPSLTISWYRCDTAVSAKTSAPPSDCALIAGASGPSFTVDNSSAGKFLSTLVVAENEHGEARSFSPSSSQVYETPSFSDGPSVLEIGSLIAGSQLAVAAGEVRGIPAPAPSYAWYRCSSKVDSTSSTVPSACVAIASQVAQSYTIVAADVGKYIVSSVKLTNVVAAVTKFSKSTEVVQSLPAFTRDPAITGNPWVGYSLTESGSVVTGSPSPTKTYEWFACPTARAVNLSVDSCTLIGDAAANTLVVPIEANTRFVVVRVTASNGTTPVSKTSASTTVVKQTPTNVTAPTLSTNVAKVGTSITGSRGDWIGTPTITYTYAWYACPTAVADASATLSNACAVIAGATSLSFTPTMTQEQKFLVFGVSATNGTAVTTHFSASTNAVASPPVYQSGATATPQAATASSNGAPRVGGVVDAIEGTWRGFPTLDYAYQWFTCPTPRTSASQAISENCVDVDGETADTISVTSAMADLYLGYKVTGSNFVGNDWRYSATTTLPVAVSPSMVDAPVASGYPFVDGVLRTTSGTWTGSPDPTESIRWWVCTNPVSEYTAETPTDCSQSSFAGTSLTVVSSMVGKYVSAAVTSTNVAGSETVWTASLGPVTTGAINTVAPTLTVAPLGEPKNTGTVSANRGSWSGTPALTDESFSYRWYRCEESVTAASNELARGCALVDNEFDAVHTIVEDDGGYFLLAGVTGENSQGSSTTFTAATAKVNVIPRNTVAPAISGRSFAREEMTATSGDWVSLPAAQFSYQWFLCADEIAEPPEVDFGDTPSGCSIVSGATTNRFTPGLDMLGKYAIVRVTANNIAGTRAAWSATSSAIVSGPVNQVAPRVIVVNPVTAKPLVPDSSLSTDGGTWFGSPTSYQYQWIRCVSAVAAASSSAPAAGNGCVPIDTATEETYQPQEADRGKFLLVRVTAINSIDSTAHYSATSLVINLRPRIDVAPSIVGKPFIENTVTASGDAWVAHPEVSRTYQWIQCASADAVPSSTIPAGCALISGETSSTLRIGSSLLGKFVFAGVTASNGFGPSATSWSAATTEVVRGPVNTVSPLISGTAHYPGKPPLTTTDGTWVGTPTPSISYQWYRCPAEVTAASNTLPEGCVAIDGATENARQLSADDPSFALVVGVTGTNSHGFTTKFARSTTRVTEPVSLVAAPVIGGAPKVGSTLTSNQGSWRGYPEPSISHAWYSCSSRVLAAGSTVPAGCTAIATTNRATLLLSETQTGRYIVYAATRTNLTDGISKTVTTFSASTTVVTEPVRLVSKPILIAPAGAPTDTSPEIGGVWTASAVWANPQPTVRFQWYRCTTYLNTGLTRITELPAGCEEISGATANTYTIVFADRGKHITVAAIGTNSTETLTEWANSTRDVVYVPVATTLPTVSGERNAPELLTADPGVWEGSPEPTISFQWYRCANPVPDTVTSLPSGCELISGETEQAYQQTSLSDPGKYLTVRVMGASSPSARTSYWVAVTASQATATRPANTQSPVWAFPVGSQSRLAVGESILVKDDQWTAIPGFSRSYQWYTCESIVTVASNEISAGCQAIDGATEQQYTLTQQDAVDANYFLAAVTASNVAGDTTKFSASTRSTVDAALVSVSPSEITTNNNDVISTSVDFTRGVWTKTGAKLQVSYTWLHCAQPISQILSYTPNGCNLIGSAAVYPADGCPVTNPLTALSMPEGSRYSGRYIALMEIVTPVTATSPCVFTQQTRLATRVSVSTNYIAEAPKLWMGSATMTVVNPSVPLKERLGVSSAGALGVWPAVYPAPTTGTWRGSPVGTVSTKWFRCETTQIVSASTLDSDTTSLPVDCSYISGATSANYTPTAEDLLHYLGMDVTASNDVGSSTVRTATSRSVTEDVKNTLAPTISSEHIVGETITVSDGDWTGTPAPTISRKWFLCPVASVQGAPLASGCAEVAGETGNSLSLSPAAAGKFVVSQITGQNFAYGVTDETVTLSVTSASSVKILKIPVNVSSPLLTGGSSANVGDSIVMVAGTWDGVETPTYTYRWIVCDASPTEAFTTNLPDGCAVTPGSLKTLLLSSIHAGKWLIGQEIATNAAGMTYANSSISSRVTEAPRSLTEPTISAQRSVGETITATAGTWSGFPNPTLSYQWYACDAAATTPSDPLTSCAAIGTETTSRTLVLGATHASKRIRVQEIARNLLNPSSGGAPRSGTGNKASISSEPVRMAPVFDGTPSVGGVVHVGMTATAATGSVRGHETPTFTYTWYACDSAQSTSPVSVPAGCVELLANQGSASYLVDPSAAGKHLMVAITATNPTGTAVKISPTSSSRVTLTPTLTGTEPIISGDALVGGTALTVSTGVWTSFPSPPSYTYQWYSCAGEQSVESDVVPNSCAVITGATLGTYSPTVAVQGKFLIAKVTATIVANSGGTAATARVTKSTIAIKSSPTFSVGPTISGVHHVGMTLTASATIDGFSAPTVGYEWYHCRDAVSLNWTTVPGTCTQVSGANAATITVPAGTEGRYLVVRMTASNSYTDLPGKAPVSRNSFSSAAVSSTPVISATDPLISGDAFVGGTPLTVTPGTWVGTPAPTYNYAWYACSTVQGTAADTVPAGCTQLTGSTSQYTPVRADAGKYILAKVTATSAVNSGADGSTDRVTSSTAVILSAPVFAATPTVSGVQQVGSTVTASASATGTSSPTIAYSWFACDTSVTTTTGTMPANCGEISGENTRTLVIPDSAKNKFVVVRTIATNSFTDLPGKTPVTANSVSNTRVTKTPVITGDPTISGDAFIGGTPLSVSTGNWEPDPTPTFTYAWFSCTSNQAVATDTPPSGCTQIAGQTLRTYSPTSAVLGRFIIARVTATATPAPGGDGTTDRYTSSTDSIKSAPLFTAGPTVTGTQRVGATLTAAHTVTGTSTPSVGYAWYHCSSQIATAVTTVPSTCSLIAGENSPTLVVPAVASRRFVIAMATATNSYTALPGKTAVTKSSVTKTSVAAATRTALDLTDRLMFERME